MYAKARWGAAAGAALLFLASLLFIALSGSGQGEAPVGLPLGQEGEELLLFAEGAAGPCLVYRQGPGGYLIQIDPSAGGIARREATYPLLGAACQGGRLFIFREDGPFFSAVEFNEALEEQASCTPPLFWDDLSLFGCTSQGAIYAVTQSEKTTLQLHQRDGSMWTKTFPGEITWMQVAADGGLWVYAGGTLYLGDSLAPDSLTAVTGGAPLHATGSGAYIGADGFLWRVEGSQAQPVLEGPFSPFLCCACEGGILSAGSSGLVTRLLWDGSAAGTCQFTGELVAITEKSALYRAEGQVFFAPLSLREDTPTPAPQPTGAPSPAPSLQPEGSPTPMPSFSPSPSLSPDPSLPPGLPEEDLPEFRDGYLFVPETLSLARLRDLLHPQEILLRTASGEPVTEGRLATGMLAVLEEEYQLVVRGDCDGNGAVNSHDVLRGQEILLQGKNSTDEVFFLAADVDGDGEVTTKDLLWIADHFS